MLERNSKYIDQKAIVAERLNLVFNLTPEESLEAIRTGNLLFSDMLSDEAAKQYRDSTNTDKDNVYHTSPIMATVLLEYNTSKDSKLSSKELREALSIALSRDSLSKAMGADFSTAAALLPEIAKVNGESFFSPLYETTDAQTARAKTLLGNKKDLSIVFLTDDSRQSVDLANNIVKAWGKLV